MTEGTGVGVADPMVGVRALLDACADVIIGVSPAGIISYASSRVEAVFGYLPAELLGRPVEALLPDRLAEGHVGHRTRFMRDPIARPMGIGMDLVGRRKDGSEFPVEISLAPVVTVTGTSVFATVVDITLRKSLEAHVARAERANDVDALRASEERFTAFMDASPTLAWITDADGRYVYVNRGWNERFGLERGSWVGRTAVELAVDDNEGSNGSRRYWDDYRFAFRGAGDQELVGGIAIDATDRTTGQRQLRRNAELVDRMEELAKVGAWAVEIPSMGVTVSQGINRIQEMPPEVTFDFEALFSDYLPEFFPAMRDAVRSAIDDGTGWDVEMPLRTASGRTVWARSIGTAVVEDGVVVRVIGARQDVTEFHLMRERVQTLNRDLEQRVIDRTADLEAANGELESFSYSVSHDLRAPLRAISGFAQILARRHRPTLDEQGRHYLDNIVSASERMGVLIEDLLRYSRIGRTAAPTEAVTLGVILARLAEVFEARAQACNLQLDVIRPLATPRGNATLIEQILTNLIDNALLYHRQTDCPFIRVSSRQRGDVVLIQVTDNGIGIAPEHLDRIFDVFQRLHADEDYPGTGIGLATVRKAARRMAGEVTVESELGVGTTFTVSLPAFGGPDSHR